MWTLKEFLAWLMEPSLPVTWWMEAQGHFKLQSLVERTMGFSSLIGGEQKFAHLAFTLKANRQRPPKRLYDSTL